MTLRRVLLAVVLVALAVLAAVFAYLNPETISVDIGLMRLEAVPKVVAFAGVFGLGWLFGLLCAATALLRMSRERHRLRREVRLAETEISSLRGLPLHDAH